MNETPGKVFTYVVAKEPIPATIQTLTHRIHGEVHIRRGERLLDTLNNEPPFLAITNAVVYDAAGRAVYQAHFLTVHKQHIVWLLPDAERKE